MREIRTHGSMSGDWKRDQGSRTEARSESDGTATGPYRRRASPRLYRNQELNIWATVRVEIVSRKPSGRGMILVNLRVGELTQLLVS